MDDELNALRALAAWARRNVVGRSRPPRYLLHLLARLSALDPVRYPPTGRDNSGGEP